MKRKINFLRINNKKGINTTALLFYIILTELLVLGWLTLLIFHTYSL
jgi:hypothetical protein